MTILGKDEINISYIDNPNKTVYGPRFFRVNVVLVAEYLDS